MLKKFVARMQEPSTWAGLSAIAVLMGMPVTNVELVTKAAASVLALGAILLPEKK
jgi:hypothetical protein